MKIEQPGPTRLTVAIEDVEETEALGGALAAVARPGDVIALVGTLGAGKTRLSRAIAEALGVEPEAIASPTFVLIHEYDAEPFPIYHFDAYRLESPEAFDALGAADYWTEGTGLCLIEWANLVADRLPSDAWWVAIAPGDGPSARTVSVTYPEPDRISDLLRGLSDSNAARSGPR